MEIFSLNHAHMGIFWPSVDETGTRFISTCMHGIASVKSDAERPLTVFQWAVFSPIYGRSLSE